MFKSSKVIIILLVFLLSVSKLISNTKEAVFKTASFVVQQDSILIKKLQKLKNQSKSENNIEALRIGLELIEESLLKKDYIIAVESSSTVAEIFSKTRNYNKAINTYKRTLSLINKHYNPTILDNSSFNLNRNKIEFIKAKTLLSLGSMYLRLNSKSQLKKYKDSTLYYYNNIINDDSLLSKELLGVKAKAFSNLAGVYAADSSYDKAIEYANKAILIHRNQNNKLSEAAALSNLANVYLYQEDYESAKEIYEKGIFLIRNYKSNLAEQFREGLYENLGYSMYMLKDYKAYEYQEKSYTIKDSLRDKEIKKIVAEINGKFNVDVAKRMVRQEEELKREKAERNTWILGISSFFIIVLLVFFLNQYKLRQKNLGLELSKQELMQQQKIEKIKSESQIRILNATIDGKEKERKQIAETLHDSVSALLSSANLHLQACKKQFNGTTPIEVDKSQSIINEASQKIRDLSHTLVSSILLKFGLSYAIKDIAEKYSNSQLHIDYETKYIQRYDQRFEIKLYNIIQEFVNNILKHSNATHASITLVEKNKKLKLIIKDNGDGFDKEVIPEKDGLGINQIDARIQMMQGKFNIESGKGKGTLITIELPVFERAPVKFA